MKIQSASRSLAGWLIVIASAVVVAACGGGGASTSTGANQGGSPTLAPAGATFYAGVLNTIVVAGGHRPYRLTSSEPNLLPVPSTLNAGSFDVAPANPGVIDAGLQPGDLPVRTVTITLIDADQKTATISIKVAQNFLTGYGVSFSSTCPPVSSGAPPPSACGGGETTVTLRSVTNGNLFGNRLVRFDVIRGPFAFEPLAGGTINAQGGFTTTTDHEGNAVALFRVNNGAGGQFAVLRVTDVATGAYVDEVFTISSSAPTTLTAIPNTFTFTGPLAGICGTGSAQFLVFDGQPPYTAISSDPNITVTPSSTGGNPATFTVTASNPNVCVSGGTVIVTDSAGGRTTITVNTAQGTLVPTPPPPLTISPSSITLVCGTSGSVTVVGGTGSYSVVNSTHPRVTAVVSGNTLTITRLAGDPAATAFPTTGTISLSDGTSVGTVTVTAPANCP